MGKLFSAVFNVFAWLWNHFWGTLFIVGGILGFAHLDEVPFYFPFLAIGLGIYFYWSPSWSRAAQKAAEKAIARSGESDGASAQVAAGQTAAAPATPTLTTAAPVDPETAKKLQQVRVVGIVLLVVTLLVMAVGVPSTLEFPVMVLLLASLAALSVPAYLVKLLSVLHKPQSGPQVPVMPQADGQPMSAQAVPMPAAPGPGLPARFKAMPQQAKLVVVGGTIVTVLLVVIVVLLGTGNSRDSFADQSDVYVEEDYSYEGDEVAVEPDPVAVSADAQALTEDDLFSSAPSDGSMEYAEVVYGGVVEWYGGGDALIDFTIVSRNPQEWYTAGLPTDVGCYVDYKQVSFSNYQTAMSESADRRGMIVFNNQGLYELHVLTQGQRASARTPDKNQVVIVPEYMELDLPYAEWADLGPDSAMEAHDSAVEQAFADVGLIAVIRREPVSDGSQPTQEPRAGSSVPVGTKVYITIYTAN